MRTGGWLILVVMAAACGDDTYPPASASDQRYAAEAYARDDLACQSDADCCAVIDACSNEALVVLVSDRPAVEALLEGAKDVGCTNCIPPAVQVTCEANRCVGASVGGSVSDEATLTKLRQSHCGSLPLPESSGAQMRVITCGE